jgi:hypothetical protein
MLPVESSISVISMLQFLINKYVYTGGSLYIHVLSYLQFFFSVMKSINVVSVAMVEAVIHVESVLHSFPDLLHHSDSVISFPGHSPLC